MTRVTDLERIVELTKASQPERFDDVAREVNTLALRLLGEARTRNIVSAETAVANRRRPGGYTFNAFTPDDYHGTAFSFASVRIGDHAHIEVESGRAIGTPPGGAHAELRTSRAGKLILRWHEWLELRAILDADPRVRIAEVEHPTPGQVERYA